MIDGDMRLNAWLNRIGRLIDESIEVSLMIRINEFAVRCVMNPTELDANGRPEAPVDDIGRGKLNA
jgi:hypothetical protein